MIDHPSTFARQFARLVSLLARDPEAVDAQKGSLRAAVLLVRARPMALARGGDRLAVNREALSTAIPDVGALAARLDAHGLTLVRVEAGASAAALLAAARRLAAEPVAGGARGDGAADGELVVRGAATPGDGSEPAAGADPAPGLERAGDGAPAGPGGDAPPHAEAAAAALLVRVRDARAAADAAPLVDELAERAALAARAGDGAAVVALLHGMLERLAPECDRADPALAAALARLTAAEHLELVCDATVRGRVDRDRGDAVLAASPAAGDTLARRLAAAATPAERAGYRDALVRLRGGGGALIALLDHPSPAVATCAADALAEVGGAGAHTALVRALEHPDATVRCAAGRALGALRAPRAAPALRSALGDASPAVRGEAANALVLVGGSGVGSVLGDALADERHPESQLELLAALGRLATAEAVQYLVHAAAPAGRLFGRKPVPFRCAAVAALGAARTPAALAALRELTNDREREVREAVFLAAVGGSGAARPRVEER